MAWVKLEESGVPYAADFGEQPGLFLNGESVVVCNNQMDRSWSITTNVPVSWRITCESYSATDYLEYTQLASFRMEDQLVTNSALTPSITFIPTQIISSESVDSLQYFPMQNGSEEVRETYRFLIEIEEAGPGPEPEPGVYSRSLVYEMEKGWTFDGNYIPHFLELNWLFEEDPFTYKSINKIRVHGLTKGNVNLQVKVAGMQGDVVTDYISDYMDPQFIDLPFTPMYVEGDYSSVTNYIDYSDRGIALQMRFEGRNTDITKPEPSHVLQVLALQGTPQGNGKRAN